MSTVPVAFTLVDTVADKFLPAKCKTIVSHKDDDTDTRHMAISFIIEFCKNVNEQDCSNE